MDGALARADLLPLLDVDRLSLVRTTFVARDFRHVEADVVLTAPLRLPGSASQQTVAWIYLLIEHQSEPDALMPIRLLDYVVQIIKAQLRAWTNSHASFAGFRVQPIVPLVLYHERKGAQRRALHRVIETSVQSDRHRQEVDTMQRTIAEEMQEKGRRKGIREGAARARQETLLRQLRRRFGEVPEALAAAVNACKDVQQLDAWLDNVVTARSLAGVGID